MPDSFNISNLKNREWIVQKGIGIITTVYPIVELGSIHLAKRSKVYFDPIICLFKDKVGLYITDKENSRNIGKYLLNIEKSRSGSVKELYNQWLKDFTEFNNHCKKLQNTDLNILSVKELAALYKRLISTYLDEYSLAEVVDGFSFLMDDVFPTAVSANIENKKTADKVINLLTTPNFETFFETERNFLTNNQNLNDYKENFYWIRSDYEQKKEIDQVFFNQKLSERTTEGKKESRQEKEEIIKQYNLSYEVKLMVELIDLTGYWQDQRKKANMMGDYWIHSFNDVFSQKLNKKLIELQNLTPQEMIAVAEGGEIAENTKNRLKKCGFIGTKEKTVFIPEDEVDQVRSIINQVDENKKDQIKGFVASLGKARGRVKIILSMSDMAKMKEGEILVSSMTRPELLPAIKRAAAIVTDEGGITCHAAIISRELGIPCIIGTKVATNVLRDGDMVEVDADKGLVKIINN